MNSKQAQFKANFQNGKNNATSFTSNDYEIKPPFQTPAKQSQNKANSKLMQTPFIAASPLVEPEQSRLQNVERLLAFEPVILIITGLE